jgi:hypothetical protein
MITDETTEASPFAAFAVPKRNPIEELEERQRRAAIARRKMLGSLLAALVGCIGGATTFAAFEHDFDIVFTAAVGSLIGAVLGVVVGSILGAACFGALSMTDARSPGIGTSFVRRDPMSALRGLTFAWSLMGTAIGAARGAEYGVHWAGAVPGLIQWTMMGTLIGGGFGLVVWFFTMSRIRRIAEITPATRR